MLASISYRHYLASFAVAALLVAPPADAQVPASDLPVEPPLPVGALEIVVSKLAGVSGVAWVKDDQYLIVGDDEPLNFFDTKTGDFKPYMSVFGPQLICDAEDIEVGTSSAGSQLMFVLSEDHNAVFVQGGHKIPLPLDFSERCNRGAEGLSVRWTSDGWDLLVLSEGGALEPKHIDDKEKEASTDACVVKPREQQENCPFDMTKIRNPILARYRVSADGKQHELKDSHALPTTELLKGKTPEQGFRASDVAWWYGKVLVLLGSTPAQDSDKPPFNHTWIKGFNLDGTPVPNMTIKLEETRTWQDFRKGKNWEGLDTLFDGRLVLSYDNGSTSQLVIFSPSFPQD